MIDIHISQTWAEYVYIYQIWQDDIQISSYQVATPGDLPHIHTTSHKDKLQWALIYRVVFTLSMQITHKILSTNKLKTLSTDDISWLNTNLALQHHILSNHMHALIIGHEIVFKLRADTYSGIFTHKRAPDIKERGY